ncbi:hypothetical protein AB0M43_32970 [Longispora sp. NPDC051575]|uniref:hypothetical protein n=1 Tax=Longispora sp. NPDC051575 TaxID=3154943 RepID=UPI00342AF2DC
MRIRVGWIAAVTVVVVGCCSLMLYAERSEPFLPHEDEALPLPAGLSGQKGETGSGNCGSGVCTWRITVRSTSGASPVQVLDQVREHLKEKHEWRLDGNGAACRPNSFVDRREACVETLLDPATGDVVIQLSGSRVSP